MENIKDRLTCLSCKKVIVNTNRERILNCPHCGCWIHLVQWLEEEESDELSAILDQTEVIERGIEYQVAGKYDEANKLYDEALTNGSIDHHVIWMNKGAISIKLKKYDEAVDYYSKAVGLSRGSNEKVAALVAKGSALSELKRYAEAVEYYNKAYAIDERDEKVKVFGMYLMLQNKETWQEMADWKEIDNETAPKSHKKVKAVKKWLIEFWNA